jgi:hypothetical protein
MSVQHLTIEGLVHCPYLISVEVETRRKFFVKLSNVNFIKKLRYSDRRTDGHIEAKRHISGRFLCERACKLIKTKRALRDSQPSPAAAVEQRPSAALLCLLLTPQGDAGCGQSVRPCHRCVFVTTHRYSNHVTNKETAGTG